MFYSIKHAPHFFKEKYGGFLSRLSTNFPWCIVKFFRDFFRVENPVLSPRKTKNLFPFGRDCALVSAPICACLFMLTYALLFALLCLRLSSAYIIFAPLCLRAGDKSVHQHTHHCGYKHDEYGVQSFAFDFHVCHHHQHAKYDEADIVKVTHAFPHR